jgi:hypothetical protein
MRRSDEVFEALELLSRGLTPAEVEWRTGIPRSTIRNWRDGRCRRLEASGNACPACRQMCLPLPIDRHEAYSYLLGQYLGDGGIYEHPRQVYRLVIFGDARYTEIANDVAIAMSTVAPHIGVNHQRRGPERTVLTTYSYSRSWPCLFPQHGRGPKHERVIELVSWQAEITRAHPEALLRGLIHSDGCRALNTIRHGKKVYAYPRYQFSNRSADIRAIFCEHLDLLDIPWRRMNPWTISVARREAVARLDEFIGPKT